jgi:hypothetical protein
MSYIEQGRGAAGPAYTWKRMRVEGNILLAKAMAGTLAAEEGVFEVRTIADMEQPVPKVPVGLRLQMRGVPGGFGYDAIENVPLRLVKPFDTIANATHAIIHNIVGCPREIRNAKHNAITLYPTVDTDVAVLLQVLLRQYTHAPYNPTVSMNTDFICIENAHAPNCNEYCRVALVRETIEHLLHTQMFACNAICFYENVLMSTRECYNELLTGTIVHNDHRVFPGYTRELARSMISHMTRTVVPGFYRELFVDNYDPMGEGLSSIPLMSRDIDQNDRMRFFKVVLDESDEYKKCDTLYKGTGAKYTDFVIDETQYVVKDKPDEQVASGNWLSTKAPVEGVIYEMATGIEGIMM